MSAGRGSSFSTDESPDVAVWELYAVDGAGIVIWGS